MARAIAVLFGALIITAVAHVTIQATGGYGTGHSWLTIAVGAGVAAGSVFSGMAWSDDRRTLATLLVLAIVAGEAYGLIATAERLIVGREAAQAPLRQLAEDRASAQRNLEAATMALARFPLSTPRLDKALADKAATDAAVVAKSAERGCVENCRRLLQAQADAAEQEVDRARADMERQRSDAVRHIARAKTDLESLKPPASPTPLADRLGWSAWVLDLLQSALGSIAANGLACFLMVFGAHRSKRTAQSGDVEVKPFEATAAAQGRSRKRAKRPGDPKRENDPIWQAKAFAVARLMPNDAIGAATNVKDVLREYATWCRASSINQLPVETIASALNSLFGVEKDGKDYMVIGVSLKTIEQSSKALGALH